MNRTLKRRALILGAALILTGCSAISAIDQAAQPLDTFDLAAAPGSQNGQRTKRTLLVLRPEAAAPVASDRIMVKPGPRSVTYLPDARWSDEVPSLFQSLLVRSISATERVGYVGQIENGPVADSVVLVRLDAFNINVMPNGDFEAAVDVTLTVLDDRDQTVLATRRFTDTALSPDDRPATVAATFQVILDQLLPEMSDWAINNGMF